MLFMFFSVCLFPAESQTDTQTDGRTGREDSAHHYSVSQRQTDTRDALEPQVFVFKSVRFTTASFLSD